MARNKDRIIESLAIAIAENPGGNRKQWSDAIGIDYHYLSAHPEVLPMAYGRIAEVEKIDDILHTAIQRMALYMEYDEDDNRRYDATKTLAKIALQSPATNIFIGNSYSVDTDIQNSIGGGTNGTEQ